MATDLVAPDLHNGDGEFSAPQGPSRRKAPQGPMTKDLQIRFAAILLAVMTVTAVVFAYINYDKERQWV